MLKNGVVSILRIVMALAVVSGLSNGALAQTQRTPAREPVMTAELMGRLIKYARDGKVTGGLSARSCKALSLCDGTKDMPFKFLQSDVADHYLGFRPEDPDAKDIVIVVKRDGNMETYLTDKTGRLRAAAVEDKEIARLITNEKAGAKFQAELALFAKEAAEQLPPTK
jgi:hypothetical protein